MKLSLIQMNSGHDKAANLAAADALARAAIARDAPDMIAFPEMWPCLGGDPDIKHAAAEELPADAEPEGEAWRLLRDLAREHGVFVHGGSIPELGGDRLHNTTVAFGPDGTEVTRYRKIHMFDVVTPDGREYRESAVFGRGDAIVTYRAHGLTVGCAICYDLRFPEMFRALEDAGADLVMLPSAFTLLTGKDHWEPLIRARAIETQVWLAAPAQWGPHTDRGRPRDCYGHSLLADPWGHVVARARDGVGHVTATVDQDYLREVRAKMPVRTHHVLGSR